MSAEQAGHTEQTSWHRNDGRDPRFRDILRSVLLGYESWRGDLSTSSAMNTGLVMGGVDDYLSSRIEMTGPAMSREERTALQDDKLRNIFHVRD